jgi:hypothetical protein
MSLPEKLRREPQQTPADFRCAGDLEKLPVLDKTTRSRLGRRRPRPTKLLPSHACLAVQNLDSNRDLPCRQPQIASGEEDMLLQVA